MKRRNFLKASGLGLAGVCFTPNSLLAIKIKDQDSYDDFSSAGAGAESLVVEVHHSQAADQSGKINKTVVRNMVDEGIKVLTSTKSHQEGWQKIFSSYVSQDIIGLKVNAANRQLPTHPEVTYAIADSLSDSDFKENFILIWDCNEKNLKKTGYSINDKEKGYLCFGTTRWGAGYDKRSKVKISSANKELPLSKILTQHCDHIVNVPVLKNATPAPGSSFDVSAGVTLSLKNAYGYIPLNDQFWQFKFLESLENMKAMHADNCNPQIAELNASPLIRKKTTLAICDALLAIYDGGPYGPAQGIENKIIMSKDLVALDSIGLEIIEKGRADRKLAPARKFASHIESAERLGIGNMNLNKITMERVDLG